MENVTTWGVHVLVGRRNHSRRNRQISLMRAIQRKLDYYDIVFEVEAVKLSMHVWKGSGIDVHGKTDILTVIFFPGGHVIEIAAFAKEGDEFRSIFGGARRGGVELTNHCGVFLFFGCLRLIHQFLLVKNLPAL